MILYQSNTDNLWIERKCATEDLYRFHVRYGQKEIATWTEYTSGDPIRDNRDHARIARQWIIDNRWNGNA
jgi:hypothetical protein